MKDSEKNKAEKSKKRVAITASIPLEEWDKSTDNLYKPLSSYLSYRGVINKEKFFDLYNLNPKDFDSKKGYEDEATKILAEGLKGTSSERFRDVLSEFVEERVWPKIYEEFKGSISFLNENDFYTALWSSLPSEMLKIVADRGHLNLDEFRGQELETRKEGEIEKYNGKRKRIIAGERGRKQFKKDLEKKFESEDLTPELYLGIVESEEDPLVDWVKNPYFYDPTKEPEEERETKIPKIKDFRKFYSEIKDKLSGKGE